MMPTASFETWSRARLAMLHRINDPAARVSAGFPHYADAQTGDWTVSAAGDWTGGFWNGLLWLAAATEENTRDHYCSLAERWTKMLEPRLESETIFRGFLFYYGAVLGAILLENDHARQTALAGAHELATLYNPAAGLLPLGGEAEEASDVGRYETSIDGVQGMALLHWAARETGEERLANIAVQHALRHIGFCVRDDGSVCQSASFDAESGQMTRRYTHKGLRSDSTWNRAQAWAMLGYAVNASWAPQQAEFIDAAVLVADWWLEHVPDDRVAYWDFDASEGPQTLRDTSGTAIAAASLLKLAKISPTSEQRTRYRREAESTVAALIDRHLVPFDDPRGRVAGALTDGCYNHRIGLATQSELIWGDYYLFEALNVLCEKIHPELV